MLILYYPNPEPNPNPNLMSLHGTQTHNLIHPNHYSLYVYIPALAQIARIQPKPQPPPPLTLNSAADVGQSATELSTWDLKGCWTGLSSHQWWFQGVPEARFGDPDVCLDLQDAARCRQDGVKVDPRCHQDLCKCLEMS